MEKYHYFAHYLNIYIKLYHYILSVLNQEARYWIEKLNLRQHPEGGYFIETYKSEKFVRLPEYDGARHACTAIYYLLIGDQFSSFHRIKSDEIWHLYGQQFIFVYNRNKK